MRTKEECYELVLENRKLAADPSVTKCPCPSELCEWHGKCKECVALHRYHKEHVPFCPQPILRDKIKAIAAAGRDGYRSKARNTDRILAVCQRTG